MTSFKPTHKRYQPRATNTDPEIMAAYIIHWDQIIV